MESTNSSENLVQPPSCAGENEDSNCDGVLTFVDFLPQCQTTDGLSLKPIYETFRALVDRANYWLQANRKLKVVTCESVVFKDRKNQVKITNRMNYKVRKVLETGMMHRHLSLTNYIRGLRLWLSERNEEAETPQQIGYWTLVPRQVGGGGLVGHPRFETLDEVLRSFNSSLHSSSMSGPIINVETQVIKMPYYREIDPERSNWKEGRNCTNSKRCLCVIRVYYEFMAGNPEEIGVKDFIPEKTEFFEYEPFADVVWRASDWCSTQKGLEICNIQTVDMKIKSGAEYPDTQKMWFTETGEITQYLRILRVAYTRPRESDVSSIRRPNTEVAELTYRTFMPILLKENVTCADEYETLQQTKTRMTAWLKATGTRVINAETLAIRDAYNKFRHEKCYTMNDGEEEQVNWLFLIRLYFNGAYREPPPDMLPPVPEPYTPCCAIL